MEDQPDLSLSALLEAAPLLDDGAFDATNEQTSPSALPPVHAKIPDEDPVGLGELYTGPTGPVADQFKQSRVWTTYLLEQDQKTGKLAKRPTTDGIRPASIHEAATLTFDEAVERAQRLNRSSGVARYSNSWVGIGAQPNRGCGVIALDIDKCVSDGQIIDPQVAEAINQVESYAEFSPSGTGLRVWVERTNDTITKTDGGIMLTAPDGTQSLLPMDGHEPPEDGSFVEDYGTAASGTSGTGFEASGIGGKFFTFTGHRLPGSPREINPAPAIRNLVFRKAPPKNKKSAELLGRTPRRYQRTRDICSVFQSFGARRKVEIALGR